METGTSLFDQGEDERHYDLAEIARRVRNDYFPELSELVVRWGKMPPQRIRQSIRLGSYDPSSSAITIHPLLDSPQVPVWFVQSVVHHEYLHHVLGPKHDRRFRAWESRFRHHREAEAWLRINLLSLLGRRRGAAIRRKAHTKRLRQARLF